MPTMVSLSCESCGKKFERRVGEVNRNRKAGRRILCSLSCTAKICNAPRKAKEVIKECPYCGERFVSSTHNKAASFCSRSCASKGSMTDERREAQRIAGLSKVANLISTEEALKRREAWKYELLKIALVGRHHEFEFRIGKYIYDLALLDTKVLVEFDGKYHENKNQKEIDKDKDEVAKQNGFIVIRRATISMNVIDPSVIDGV